MEILHIHTRGAHLSLSDADWEVLLDKTDGYSGCDLANLISSARLEPMRDMLKATHWVTTCCKYFCNIMVEYHDKF
jgi:SpoVK/Ycf46/Vps4 family AAA+-type ATPase